MAHYKIRNKVFEYRTAAGLTQRELAERIGVSRQTIIAMERGNYTPSLLLTLRLVKVFKTKVEDMFSIWKK